MHVADAWEQVMFHLKIQSTKKPVPHLVVRSEVDGCSYLMHSPFRLHMLRVRRPWNEIGILYHMRQLEYDRDHYSGHEHHNTVTDQRWNHPCEEHRKHHEDRKVTHFRSPENEMLLQA